MKYLKLLILLLPLQILEAQPNRGVYWGVLINANILYENNKGSNSFEISPPPNLYLHFGNVFNKYLNVNIFAGYIAFSGNWDGFDIGFDLKPQVLDKFYITAGFNYNSISGGTGEGNQAPIYYKKDFTYGNLGIGFFVTKIAFVEIEYEIPMNSDKTYGISYNYNPNEQLKLISRIKLDFGWDFSF